MSDLIDLTKDDDAPVPLVRQTASSSAVVTTNRNTYWCGTFNYGRENQPDTDAVMRWWAGLQKVASYAVGGWEIAETGQPHLQFYFQLKPNTPKRLSELKKLPDGLTVHYEVARGSDAENFDYCTKDAEYMEFGARRESDPGSREQNRWKRARELAQDGELDLIDDQIFVCHYSSIRNISRDFQRPPPSLDGPADLQCGLWIYGPTGTGKSRYARETYPEAFLKLANKWWDGYRDQAYALLEDYDKEHKCLGHHLKIWADRYPFPVEIKGTTTCIRPQLLVITSNYHPREIWGDEPSTLDPILRRFKLMPMGVVEAELVLPEPTQSSAVATNGFLARCDTPHPSAPRGPSGTVIVNPRSPDEHHADRGCC